MVMTCFLCKWANYKLPRRSYHKFPTDEALKQKWLNIIGKSNASIGKHTTLCSIHFEENCFRYGLVYGTKILKYGSVPTLHLSDSRTKNDEAKLYLKIKPLESLIESSFHTQSIADNVQEKDSNSTELFIKDNHVESSSSELYVQNNQMEVLTDLGLTSELIIKDDQSECSSSECDVQNNQMEVLTDFGLTSELIMKDDQSEQSSSEFDVPNIYIDVPTENVSPIESSNNRSSHRQLDKNILLRLKRKIFTLQRALKRIRDSKLHLKSQLKVLKKQINKYENKSMNSELDPIPQALYDEMMSSKKKAASHSLPLREFATTVATLSPKAYSYVRKIFPVLPHRATLTKWMNERKFKHGIWQTIIHQ